MGEMPALRYQEFDKLIIKQPKKTIFKSKECDPLTTVSQTQIPIQKSDSQYFRNLHSKNQYSLSSTAASEPSDSDLTGGMHSDPTLILRGSLTTTSIQHNEIENKPPTKPSPINVRNNASTSFDANQAKPDDDEQLSSSKKFSQFALDSTKSNQLLLQVIEEQQNEVHVKRPSIGSLPPQPKAA